MANTSLENGSKRATKRDFRFFCVCEFCARVVFSVRCCGSVSCHQACGARHQGNSCVLREAAAASEGHQPRVEQPHGLHVAGQARGKMLRKKYKLSRAQLYKKYTDLCTHLL